MAKETTRIIGVDFSGAKNEGKTWICKGELVGKDLYITDCRDITRSELTEKLKKLKGHVVVAMDFPFSMPMEFISDFWVKRDNEIQHAKSIADIWAAAGRIVEKEKTNKKLWKWCGNFKNGDRRKQPMRLTDRYCAGSMSALNKRMYSMTFRGMPILHLVYSVESSRFCIPPSTQDNCTKPVLLETMPGLVLSALGLPYQGYKGKAKISRENRACIWENLGTRSGITICPKETLNLKDKVNKSDDCLDAVVAAIVAALWHIDQDIFHSPPKQDERISDNILKEGWLYTPCPSKLPVHIGE